MKKKIAVFATGWSEQMLDEYMGGIHLGLQNIPADVYLFLCYPSLGDEVDYSKGELNIFKLPDMNDFDGALVLGNTIDYPDALADIDARCAAANIPVIYTGHRRKNSYFVGIDNYNGARSLCEHLCQKHGVRDLFYMAGSRDNMDSNARLEALRDVITENGGAFSDDNVFYTDWDPRAGMLFIENWIKSYRPLPHAFACANDEMAILVCSVLKKFGIKVPEDVIVTGFDNLIFAQVYDPSICSVSQHFDRVGQESVNLLMNILSGEEYSSEVTVNCECMPGESCGCFEGSNADAIRRKVSSDKFMDDLNNSAFYRKLSIIDRAIMKCKCYEDIRPNFKYANDSFNNYEGSSYHVILDPLIKAKMLDNSLQYRADGYADKMDVLFSIDNNSYLAFDNFEVRHIVPQINNPDINHLFVCLPLLDAGGCLGYVVFADDYDKFKTSELMGKYTERLSAALSRLQQTVNAQVLTEKLTELSETDALTHVKNRTAYQVRENAINHAITHGLCNDFALLLCDINSLKPINDCLGHEVGDIYIMNSCRLICQTFKRSAVYRIGGDEFVVVIDGDDYVHAEQLVDSMNEEMAKLVSMDIPSQDKISFAAGIAYYDSELDTCMADVLKRADQAMYNRKVAMKNS